MQIKYVSDRNYVRHPQEVSYVAGTAAWITGKNPPVRPCLMHLYRCMYTCTGYYGVPVPLAVCAIRDQANLHWC